MKRRCGYDHPAGKVLAGVGPEKGAGQVARRSPGRSPVQRLRLGPAAEAAYPSWTTLLQARVLVQRFADVGWIEPAALVEVDHHVAHLRRLVLADRGTIELSGNHSDALYRQVEELTGLLVALCDAAVDHQAALAANSSVPATLRDARQHLEHATQANWDL